jgi:hypothetical protein
VERLLVDENDDKFSALCVVWLTTKKKLRPSTTAKKMKTKNKSNAMKN